MPGDVITVREGIYRERIDPPRGGESDDRDTIYQAVPGGMVAIKSSEVVKGWAKAENDTWKVVLPNSLFGGFNPYPDMIKGGDNRSYNNILVDPAGLRSRARAARGEREMAVGVQLELGRRTRRTYGRFGAARQGDPGVAGFSSQ